MLFNELCKSLPKNCWRKLGTLYRTGTRWRVDSPEGNMYQPTTECKKLSRLAAFRCFHSHYNGCCFILGLTSELTNVAARSDVTSPSTSSPHSERDVYDLFSLHASTELLPQTSICLVSHSPLEGLVLSEVIS